MRIKTWSWSNFFRRSTLCVALATALFGAVGDVRGKTICEDPWWGEDPHAIALERRFVFDTVFVSGDEGPFYEVSMAPCGALHCPIQVRLRHESKVLDTMDLDVCAPPVEPVRSVDGLSIESIGGVGDPHAYEPVNGVWYVPYQHTGMGLLARSMNLAPDLRGVLIHIDEAWARASKRHFLVVSLQGRLTLAWTPPDPKADHFVRVALKDYGHDGLQQINYFRGITIITIQAPSGGIRNRKFSPVGAAIYRWNTETGRIEQLSIAEAGVPIFAFVGGIFESEVEAWAKWPQGVICAPPPYLTPTDLIPELDPGKVMFVALSWREDAVALDRDVLIEYCSDNEAVREGFVIELAAFPEPEQ